MSAKKLLFAYLRSVSGWILGGAFWLLIGWALSAFALGVVLAVWSLILGPLLIPTFTWVSARMRGQLRRIDLASDSVLAREYFAGILANPGPNPRVWVRPSSDLACLWFERPGLAGSHQEIVVSSAWMAQEPSLKARDWKILWNSIARMPGPERRLRTGQIAMWTGWSSPLEVLLAGLHVLFGLLELSNLPSPAFWSQRVCWSVRAFWFGLPPDSGRLPSPPRGTLIREPSVWNSIIWGVWFQVPARVCHPLWLLFTHRSAFLEEELAS